jgi:hypothetical protein
VASRTGVPKEAIHETICISFRAENEKKSQRKREAVSRALILKNVDPVSIRLAMSMINDARSWHTFFFSLLQFAPPSGRAQLFPIFAAFEIETMALRPLSAFPLYILMQIRQPHQSHHPLPPFHLSPSLPVTTLSSSYPQCTPRVSIAA